MVLNILSSGHGDQTEGSSRVHLNTWQSKGGWHKA